MKVSPATTLLMALSSVTILKEGKTGKKPPGLTKRYKRTRGNQLPKGIHIFLKDEIRAEQEKC